MPVLYRTMRARIIMPLLSMRNYMEWDLISRIDEIMVLFLHYLEKKEEMTRIYAPVQETAAQEVKENVSETKLTWQQQKEEQALKRKRENELKKVEARIEELETRDKEIDETMVLPDICTNVAECTKLSREKAAIAEELEGLYEKWEELA